MGLDVVRQPLMAAFVTQLVFAVAAMACTDGVYLDSGAATEVHSLLGGHLTQVQQMWPLAAKILCALVIFLSGVSVGRMTVRYGLYAVHTYLAIPFYGIFACGLFISGEYLVQYFAAALFILSMKNFYAGFCCGAFGFGEIFRASFLLGLILLIYTPAVVLSVVVLLAVVVFKRSVREFLVGVVGYLLPLFAVCYLNWAAGGAFTAPFAVLSETFLTAGGFSVYGLSLPVSILSGVSVVLFLCAALSYFFDMYAGGAKSRSILLFNLFLFLIMGSMFFLPCASSAVAAFAAVPMAFVLPLLFVRLDRRIAWFLYLGLFFLCGLCLSY